jgi:hypothetical protein
MSALHAKLWSMAAESTAVVLTERIDALAAALRAAGVSPERSSSLLSSAAAATMHAVTLDALLDEQPRMAAVAEPLAAIAGRRPEPVSLAA